MSQVKCLPIEEVNILCYVPFLHTMHSFNKMTVKY